MPAPESADPGRLTRVQVTDRLRLTGSTFGVATTRQKSPMIDRMHTIGRLLLVHHVMVIGDHPGAQLPRP